MARESLLTDKRTFHLMRLLKIDLETAIGIYEVLHLRAYNPVDPTFTNKAQLESLLSKRGQPGKTADALIESGFVEKGKGHGLQLTNFDEEAPRYVLQRRTEVAARKLAESRGTARNRAEPRTPDPIRSPDRTEKVVNPRSRSAAASGSGSTASTPFRPGQAASKSLGSGLEAVGSLAANLARGLMAGKGLGDPGGHRVDYSALTESELVIRFAGHETKNDPRLAKKLWRKRITELAGEKFGLEFARKVLSYTENNISGKIPAGETKIVRPAQYLNHATLAYLREARKAASS